jgi:hypothetical protein
MIKIKKQIVVNIGVSKFESEISKKIEKIKIKTKVQIIAILKNLFCITFILFIHYIIAMI